MLRVVQGQTHRLHGLRLHSHSLTALEKRDGYCLVLLTALLAHMLKCGHACECKGLSVIAWKGTT